METVFWDDVDVVATFEQGAAWIEFNAYEITGRGQDTSGNFTVRIYERKGAKSSADETKDLKDAQAMLRGRIKWDACSHIYFGDEGGYLHICGGDNWRKLQTVLGRVFEHASSKLKEPHSADMW